jgi:hypothetical protein
MKRGSTTSATATTSPSWLILTSLLYMSPRSEEARLRAVFDEKKKNTKPEHSDVGSLELRPCISIRALHER